MSAALNTPPAPAFSGELLRDGTSYAGTLVDAWGWKQAISTTPDGPDILHLTLQQRLSCPDLARRLQYTGTLHRVDGAWAGTVQSQDGWRIDLVGVATRPGVIALSGEVKDVPERFRNVGEVVA